MSTRTGGVHLPTTLGFSLSPTLFLPTALDFSPPSAHHRYADRHVILLAWTYGGDRGGNKQQIMQLGLSCLWTGGCPPGGVRGGCPVCFISGQPEKAPIQCSLGAWGEPEAFGPHHLAAVGSSGHFNSLPAMSLVEIGIHL